MHERFGLLKEVREQFTLNLEQVNSQINDNLIKYDNEVNGKINNAIQARASRTTIQPTQGSDRKRAQDRVRELKIMGDKRDDVTDWNDKFINAVAGVTQHPWAAKKTLKRINEIWITELDSSEVLSGQSEDDTL